MTEIKLSILDWIGQDLNVLRSLLNQFETENHCRVRVRVISWERGYTDLMNFAIHKEGPEISEVGTTWCASLGAMNVLRPFTPQEVAAFGGSSVFLPSSWQTCLMPGSEQIWAVPRLADMRAIYYRRDLLETAGVDEQHAFQTHQQLIQALKQLQESGVENPIVFPTHNIIHPSLHFLASWIWAAGGHILSQDGRRCLLNSEKSQAGIRSHLELGQYLTPASRGLDPYQADDLFWNGDAAIALTLRTPILSRIKPLAGQHLIHQIGAASALGNSFIGGTNHVIWKHVPPVKERLVVELLRAITNAQAQSAISKSCGLFPPREDLLTLKPFTEPFYDNVIEGLRSGRSFRSTSAWGKAEDLLRYTLSRLWELTTGEPQVDLNEIVAQRTDDIKRRVDLILESYYPEF